MANEITKTTEEKQYIVPDMGGIYTSAELFTGSLRLAKSFAKSPLVPKEFQSNEGSCLIAIDLASRCKMSPLMVMQNMYIVYGRPSWSSKFIIALINQSRRYATPLQFEFNDDKTSCYAWAKDYENNIITGPTITIEMAKQEGWYDKNGSKWKTMPELMLRYRAASFFGNTNCSDLLLGIPADDEIIDAGPIYDTVEEEIKAEANSAGEIGLDEVDEDQEQRSIPEPTVKEPAPVEMQAAFEGPSF
mgnify:CR=1 FL=1